MYTIIHFVAYVGPHDSGHTVSISTPIPIVIKGKHA